MSDLFLELCLPDWLTITVWLDQNFYRYRDFLSETNFSDTNTKTFFQDQIFRGSQKIVMGLETETETETFAYDWQILGTSREKF